MRPPSAPRLRSPVLAALGLLAATLACASHEPRTLALTRIVDTGLLRVGVSGEQPPLNATSRSGELIGMEVAIVNVLARSMRVKPLFVRRPFGTLLDALEAGEVDMVMSGMTITPERSQRARFVGPYYTSGKALLTRSAELAAATRPEDLDVSGLRLAALAGSTSETFARSVLGGATLVTPDSLDEAIREVIDGKVDALVADRETCDFAVLRHPDAGLHASAATFTVEPMGIAVRLDEPQLASLLETYLEALRESGALERARAFWFEDPSWVGELR